MLKVLRTLKVPILSIQHKELFSRVTKLGYASLLMENINVLEDTLVRGTLKRIRTQIVWIFKICSGEVIEREGGRFSFNPRGNL